MIDPASRERAVVGLLEEWPWELKTTLIGGYALAGYGAARYSDDIDFVLPIESRARLEDWLRERAFAAAKGEGAKSAQTFDGATRLSRGEVTIDLLYGFVRDREALVDIPESWISMRPRRTRLDLLSGSVRKDVHVARPEALWALKLQAGRAQDLTDLFALFGEPVKPLEVRSLFESLSAATLTAKLSKVRASLRNSKIYDDSRSRLGLRDSDAVRERWTAFGERVREMIPV